MPKLKISLTGTSIVLPVLLTGGATAFAAGPALGDSGAGKNGGPPPACMSASSTLPDILALPDSPGTSRATDLQVARQANAGSQQSAAPTGQTTAAKHRLTIQPNEAAVPLSAGAKMGMAFRSIVSPGGFALNVASAAVSHGTDSRPHFGTDSAGFGERVGSTVYRSTVKSMFGYGVFPALFHDDPRFYVLGPTASFKRRLVYAGTRVLVTRKDSGSTGVNWPQLLAPVVSQGSANGFYPSRDQDVTKTATGILVSYATSAGVYAGKEFSAEIRRKLHFRQ